jgi:hypothetical protein
MPSFFVLIPSASLRAANLLRMAAMQKTNLAAGRHRSYGSFGAGSGALSRTQWPNHGVKQVSRRRAVIDQHVIEPGRSSRPRFIPALALIKSWNGQTDRAADFARYQFGNQRFRPAPGPFQAIAGGAIAKDRKFFSDKCKSPVICGF